jgi:transposase
MNEVTPQAFVQAWEPSSSTAAVAQKLGMPRKTVRSRVNQYRELGVKLKLYQRGRQKTDVEGLNRLIEEIGRGG